MTNRSDNPGQSILTKLENAFEFAQHQVKGIIERTPDYFPMYTVNGKWRHTGELWTHWCDGFLPGMMWLIYEQTSDDWWREKAEHYSRLLEDRKDDRNVHDLGFIFMSTYYRWYKLTGERWLNDVLIQAGRTLSLRFREKGQYLCSFIGPQSLFIDIMMNVGIIFYAAEQTGDEQLKDLAIRHCLTTQKFLVRPDGSTAHEGIFDTDTGEFLHQDTHQGLRPDSCWSRGLSWALYGFGTAYHYSNRPEFLQTAEACADYYLARVPEGKVPYWDFDVPEGPDRLWESSAAAIAASGLWNLASLSQSQEKRQRYRDAAIEIVDTLASDRFLARAHPQWEGILMHGIYHFHKKLGVDESVMWGEHFFLEALLKVINGPAR